MEWRGKGVGIEYVCVGVWVGRGKVWRGDCGLRDRVEGNGRGWRGGGGGSL